MVFFVSKFSRTWVRSLLILYFLGWCEISEIVSSGVMWEILSVYSFKERRFPRENWVFIFYKKGYGRPNKFENIWVNLFGYWTAQGIEIMNQKFSIIQIRKTYISRNFPISRNCPRLTGIFYHFDIIINRIIFTLKIFLLWGVSD